MSRALDVLTKLPHDRCVPLPPRRLALGEGRECLVQWQPAGGPGKWRLDLTDRAESVDDATAAVQTVQADIDLTNGSSTVDWSGSDAAFTRWVQAHLADIAADICQRQEQERPILLARAQVSGQSMTIKDFIPYIVILAALAAFAHMFAVVHIR